MQSIYKVDNSYHLKEGLDSEFLVAADSPQEAKREVLRLLAEDQEMHRQRVIEDIEGLRRSVAKYDQDNLPPTNDPAELFMRRATERNKENIARLTALVNGFNGYREECLSVRKLSPRLKNGQVQYEE